MARSSSALTLTAIASAACAPPVEPEQESQATGGTIARGYGVTVGGVSYVPNDRFQSFGVVETCELVDGSTCADRSWSAAEIDALTRAAQQAGTLSGFETSFATNDPEVRVHARPEIVAAPACSSGSSTCWLGATYCSEVTEALLDAAGMPLIDAQGAASSSLMRCGRWSLELSLANIYAWSDFLGLDRGHVLRSTALHEMGHTLGLEHHRAGLMRARLPVCYFIEPGDPRDAFDPTATADAFQRFECLEGVAEPSLAPAQRAKLDAFRPAGAGWSIVEPGAPPAPTPCASPATRTNSCNERARRSATASR